MLRQIKAFSFLFFVHTQPENCIDYFKEHERDNTTPDRYRNRPYRLLHKLRTTRRDVLTQEALTTETVGQKRCQSQR